MTYLVTTTPASARPSATAPDWGNDLTCGKQTQRDCLRRIRCAWHADDQAQGAWTAGAASLPNPVAASAHILVTGSRPPTATDRTSAPSSRWPGKMTMADEVDGPDSRSQCRCGDQEVNLRTPRCRRKAAGGQLKLRPSCERHHESFGVKPSIFSVEKRLAASWHEENMPAPCRVSFISLCYITVLLVASSLPSSVKAMTSSDPEGSLPTLSLTSDLTSRSGGRTADRDDIEPDFEPG